MATPIEDPLGSFAVSHRGYSFSFILQCPVTVHFKLCTSRINYFVCLNAIYQFLATLGQKEFLTAKTEISHQLRTTGLEELNMLYCNPPILQVYSKQVGISKQQAAH